LPKLFCCLCPPVKFEVCIFLGLPITLECRFLFGNIDFRACQVAMNPRSFRLYQTVPDAK
jgi:hypothetical protein